jgi:uncharacterized damage-inducible protein DinB
MFPRINVSMFLVLLIALTSLALSNTPQDKMGMTGFRAEFIGQVQFVQGRITQLEQAMPADKFMWRPGEGVRSVGEVYMHIAFSNYMFIKISGQKVPDDINMDMDPMEWEKTVTGKDEIKKILDRSFADLIAAAKNITEADLEKNIHVFGMDMSLRSFMMTMLGHMHEHLGQSIAYARMNGVVPPWTAEQQKAEAKQ